MQNSAKRPKVSTNEESLTTPTICVLGATGVGKGSTLNSCFRSHKFSTSSMFASDTIKPASFVLPWRGTGEPMRGVDLCGFSDSEGRDTGFIEAMVSYLKQEVRYVNVFLLLLNSQEARVGMHLKDMLVALKAVFGNTFTKNVMVGFTRWDYTKKGAILRRGVTKEVGLCQCYSQRYIAPLAAPFVITSSTYACLPSNHHSHCPALTSTACTDLSLPRPCRPM